MEIVPIVGIAATCLSILLLVLILVQLNGIRGALANLEESWRRKAAADSDGAGHLDRTGAALAVVVEQLSRVEESVTAIGKWTRRSGIVPPLEAAATVASAPATASAPPVDQRSAASREAPVERAGVEQQVKPAAFEAARLPAAAAASSPNWDRGRELVDEYRKLISQPRKAEINRWADDLGGISCEATDEGGFHQISRDQGGLLVLLPLEDDSALILPGGRLVVDFATSFANVISMRSVTRETFELINDGSGVLRLVDPAFAMRTGSDWKLKQPGRLAGLKAD